MKVASRAISTQTTAIEVSPRRDIICRALALGWGAVEYCAGSITRSYKIGLIT